MVKATSIKLYVNVTFYTNYEIVIVADERSQSPNSFDRFSLEPLMLDKTQWNRQFHTWEFF